MPDIHDLTGRIPLPPPVSDHLSKSPKRKRRKNRPGRARSLINAGFILLMLGVIGFSIHQVARHVTVGLNTLRTQEILDESYVRLELYVFRDEQPLVAEGGNTCLYAVPDGGRVGVGHALGTVYSLDDPAAAAELQQKLNAYGDRLALL
ncbi:MAG: hypothetical protein IJA91_05900, partial [Clostridia bacterium]|nr:hypothetical protein [Clostridia bacterium]